MRQHVQASAADHEECKVAQDAWAQRVLHRLTGCRFCWVVKRGRKEGNQGWDAARETAAGRSGGSSGGSAIMTPDCLISQCSPSDAELNCRSTARRAGEAPAPRPCCRPLAQAAARAPADP